MWPAEGSYLGHYRLVERIDEGGMGMVYKAHEAALDRFVAVKVLSPELAKDAEFVRSFLREARAVAALNHPNITQIYFIGQHDEFIYFAMELITGHAFDRLARLEKKPTPKEWLGYFRQAATGLQYAHNHGVIHRDIKPANLILNEAGFVKVADFGLARKVGSTGESSMSVADSMGTPEYMSPEESQGETVDHRSDMYSLGASLFHMLAGKAPFTGASGTEIMMHQIHTPLPSLKKLNPQVPQAVIAIVEKLMAKAPSARYQSYDELIRAMDGVVHGKQQAATRISIPQQSQGSTYSSAQRKGPGGMTWLLVLAILGAAGFALWKIGGGQLPGGSEVTPLPATNQVATPSPGPKPPTVVPPNPRPPVPVPRATNASTQVETHTDQRPSEWVPLILTNGFNRNALSRKSDKVDGFTLGVPGVLMTTSVRRELGLGGVGLPDDGNIWIPEAVPFGKFILNFGQGNDCIWFSGEHGVPKPVHVRIHPNQRGRYAGLALLTSCANANGVLKATLYYTEGPDEVANVDLHNALRHSAGVLKNAKPAVEVTPGAQKENFTLYSQIIPCDPRRYLRDISLSVREMRPAVGASAKTIVAGVFAISALPAAKAVAGTTIATNRPATTTVAPPVAPVEEPDDYRALSARLYPLVTSLQFDQAATELTKLATAGGESQRAHWADVADDLRRLKAFKQRVIAAISVKAGRSISLVYRSGARLDAQLSYANTDELTLRKVLPSAGFVETKVPWPDLTPSSLLTVFATVADPNDSADLYDYGLLLLYQALAGQARSEDAQRALNAAAQRDPKFKTDVAEHLKALDDGTTPAAGNDETTPTPPPVSSTSTPRVERGITTPAGISRWNWTSLDLAPACNADIIYTESRAATDDFTSGLGWTTAGWLSRNNIAGDFSGIPDDGRIMLPDLEPRTALSITMPPRRNAILLTSETGSKPRPVRLDIPTELRVPCRGIALLHASANGDTLLNLDLIYTDGTIRTRPLQTLDWRAAGRSHDLAEGQAIALSTRSNRISNPSRYDMVAQLIPANEEKKLAAIIFSFASSTHPRDASAPAAAAAPSTTAAIFAVSIMPVTAEE